MIRSMTGYGDASCESAGVHYFVEVRSLNSKYFKAVIRLPEEFQGLEAEMESLLRHRLTRGSVFLTGRCNDVSGEAAYDVNASALSRYIEQIRMAPQVAAGEVRIDLGALLSLPGVLQPPANEEERHERAREAFLSILAQACDALIAMRRVEGDSLQRDLRVHRDTITARLAVIEARAPETIAAYERRLTSRIQSLVREFGVTAEPIDIIREIAAVAERNDVAEEITRLKGHIAQFGELLDRDGQPVGRTLDFLAQEMLREANTIASKCQDADMARAIVEIKGAIDRIKEQVQNVE